MPSDIVREVPAELWISIFESMNSPADLYSVICTCRHFYTYAIRPLYRHIVWNHPRDVAHNLYIWEDMPQLLTDVRSLHVEVSSMPRFPTGTFITIDGYEDIVDSSNDSFQHTFMHGLDPFFKPRTYARPELFERMMHLAATFSNLSELTCKHVLLVDSFFDTVHALPSLRRLHIENCILPTPRTISYRDHSTLPIRELTLLNLRRRVRTGEFHEYHDYYNNPHVLHENQQRDEIMHALYLARAVNLHSLRVDTTADVFTKVYRHLNPDTGEADWHPPPNMARLYVDRRRFIPEEHGGTFYPTEVSFPDRNVYGVISNCPNLHTLSMGQSLPQQLPFPANSLGNLIRFQGTPDAVLAATAGKQLDALSVLWSDAHNSTLQVLALAGRRHPTLKMLAIECVEWNDEVIIGPTQLFPELRRLRVTYQRGGPKENAMVSLGPLHLTRCKHLHTLELFEVPHPKMVYAYKEFTNGLAIADQDQRRYAVSSPPNARTNNPYLFDDSYESIEQEMSDLLIPWNRFCKSLRKVQFCRSWRMTRKWDGARWTMGKVSESEYERLETFDY